MSGPVEIELTIRNDAARVSMESAGDLSAVAALLGDVFAQVRSVGDSAARTVEASPVVPDVLEAPEDATTAHETTDLVDDTADHDEASHLSLVPDVPLENVSGSRARRQKLPDPSLVDLDGVPVGGWVEWDEVPRSRRAWNDRGDVCHTLTSPGADAAMCGMPRALPNRNRHGAFEPTLSFAATCASCAKQIQIHQRKAAS